MTRQVSRPHLPEERQTERFRDRWEAPRPGLASQASARKPGPRMAYRSHLTPTSHPEPLRGPSVGAGCPSVKHLPGPAHGTGGTGCDAGSREQPRLSSAVSVTRLTLEQTPQ